MAGLGDNDIVGDRYRLDGLIGKGGMGVVWAATHLESGRAVALKMLQTQALSRSDLRRRLLREARAAMSIRHPNVVHVYEVFETNDDEAPVVVMDLLRGETLGKRLSREEKLSVAETARILLGVTAAVAAAHEHGIVHRDLKPENIFLSCDASDVEDVKVLDFGIAKLVAADGDSLESNSLTTTGALLGTPCYMAPEQGFGEKDIDARADVWALGVVLYECLSGGRPVEGENLGQVLKRLLREGITPLRRAAPGIPAELARLVDLMLVTEREHRLSDLRQVSEVLARCARHSAPPLAATIPPEASRQSRLATTLLILSAVALAVFVAGSFARLSRSHDRPASLQRDESPHRAFDAAEAASLTEPLAPRVVAVASHMEPFAPASVVTPMPVLRGTTPEPSLPSKGRRPRRVVQAGSLSFEPRSAAPLPAAPSAAPARTTVLDGLASEPPF